MHQRAGDNLQIGPLCRRAQISARGTLPAPAAAGLLHPADIVAGARRQVVHVGMIFEADLGPGLDHRLAQQRLVGGVGGQQRPAMAVKLVLPALPALGLFEIGQDVVPRPAPVAELAPMVEILGLAADIDHAVDRARSAKHPAAGIGDRPPIGAGIGLGGEAPGDRRMVEQLHVPGGDVDQRVAVAPAGFDQHDTGTGILAEPVGQDAAGRARTDNDVIRFHSLLRRPARHRRLDFMSHRAERRIANRCGRTGPSAPALPDYTDGPPHSAISKAPRRPAAVRLRIVTT